jgi:hypothetical protein
MSFHFCHPTISVQGRNGDLRNFATPQHCNLIYSGGNHG